MVMPGGAPYFVYTYEQLGIQDPVRYTISFNIHAARVDDGISFVGSNPDLDAPIAVPVTQEAWKLSNERFQELEGKTWPAPHGQVGGSHASIKLVAGDAINPGYSAGSLQHDEFSAIEHVIEPVKALLGPALPGFAPHGS